MAGMGPAPKPEGLRARRNRPTTAATVLSFTKGKQPPLPAGFDWHPLTEDWWRVWGESPMADHMTQVDWNVLRLTAVMVNRVWEKGSIEAAKEVRLREESFGASILARLRLRITFADADENGAAEVVVSGQAGQARFGGLRAVGD